MWDRTFGITPNTVCVLLLLLLFWFCGAGDADAASGISGPAEAEAVVTPAFCSFLVGVGDEQLWLLPLVCSGTSHQQQCAVPRLQGCKGKGMPFAPGTPAALPSLPSAEGGCAGTLLSPLARGRCCHQLPAQPAAAGSLALIAS